ncbi:putative salicylate hydroxylase [Podospora australis]|uniref:Salicylate hydroxylase n=1 Tax=Podospora australis TaxID=1536484 RepID=A0AAN7AJL6_9PEZI|nr:putative salicylate hydroxylase [Podospora australis]
MTLHIIIVGAGIAGLSSAVALRRAGHAVDVYERSSMDNEVGAAINVPPNAGRFLLGWGLDPIAEQFVKAQITAFIDPLTLETLSTISHEQNRALYGGIDLWLAHRVDLHNLLKRMATDPAAPGSPAVLHSRCPVVGYDPASPSITLASGVVINGDLVIAADGIHSLASAVVLGRRVEPAPPAHYNVCYRFLISRAALEEDTETRWWNQGENGTKASVRIITHNETRRRLMSYPCRNRRVHNFVGIFYDPAMKAATKEDYLAKVDKATVLDTFQGFHPSLLAVLNKATDIKRWPLLYRPPIPTWHKEKLVLAGDAAHPMLPHQGQGGAQGLEDGCVLGIVLHGASPENIDAQIKLYEVIRRDRASAIQILSNVGQDQTHLISDELRPYFAEGDIPQNPGDILKFAFSHDIVAAAVKVMKEHDEKYELPEWFLMHKEGDANIVKNVKRFGKWRRYISHNGAP